MKVLKFIAWLMSTVFSPLIIPTYMMLILVTTSYLDVLGVGTKALLVGVTFVVTCMVPTGAIALYKAIGVVKDVSVSDRTERMGPLLTMLVSIFFFYIFINLSLANPTINGIIAGTGLAVVVQIVVNGLWKISGHMAAMGGITASVILEQAYLFPIVPLQWVLVGVVLVSGMVGSSRLLRERHTPGQVLAGYLNGLACVLLLGWYFS